MRQAAPFVAAPLSVAACGRGEPKPASAETETVASPASSSSASQGGNRSGSNSNCAYASTSTPMHPRTNRNWLIRKDGHCMRVSRDDDPRACSRIFGRAGKIPDRANAGRKTCVHDLREWLPDG